MLSIEDNELMNIEVPLEESAPLIYCQKCNRDNVPQDHRNRHMCVDCVKAENNRITYYRQHQDWVAQATEMCLDLWVQQPGETQWEFTVWTAYRDSYPGKRPSYESVAQQLTTTYDAVRKIAQRWSFPVRMSAWMSECDRITLLQRHDEILAMNKDHVDMASKLREKLKTAIDKVTPETLRPGEIASLFKVAAELERKAHTDTLAQEEMRRSMLVDTGNPELKKTPTKQNDMAEIVQILMKAGALGDITQIGVRQTKTTETTELALMGEESVTIIGVDDNEE